MTDDAESVGEFTLVRTVDAPRELVWRLWTDPAELAHWLHPRGMHVPRESVTVDLRVGGRFAYTMVDEDSEEGHESGGEYLEVDEPNRLVFTWELPDEPEQQPSVATVTLVQRDDGTRITFELRAGSVGAAEESVHRGWTDALDLLAALAAGRAS